MRGGQFDRLGARPGAVVGGEEEVADQQWEREQRARLDLVLVVEEFGEAELLLRPEAEGLFFDTFIQRRNPLVRALWAPIGPPHRRVVPALMRRAAARITARAAVYL